eukprot:TRINITY_DN10119_c0_g3_i2.p3 TRINITY_DN10119_c0_g3~~TRINITY_DN10119_c0_g3_i2.p3  ORF type:complete len:151 (+),score=10.92 TRINITY_DN10119_c0_g3_i2:565-1017(+)
MAKGTRTTFYSEMYFKAQKEIKKHTFLNFFFNTNTRYLFINDGYLYTLEKVSGSECIVKGVRPLKELFKIFLDSDNNKNVRLVFFDKKDRRLPPNHKAYEVEKHDNFLVKLKRELHRLGSDILITQDELFSGLHLLSFHFVFFYYLLTLP